MAAGAVHHDAATEQLRARIAWYYFVGGLTQQEISNRLGLTRARVNRILATCRADGIVRVEIESPFARCVALERQLSHRYGLRDAIVVPVPNDASSLQQTIGHAAASYLVDLIRPGMTLGVGWGRTLRQCVNVLPSTPAPGSTVVSLMGGLTRGSGHNTFEVASQYAEAMGAEARYLAAPIYAADEAMRETLLGNEPLADVYQRARHADVALVSVGDLSDQSILCRVDAVHPELESIRALGGVGDILAHFLDADGRLLDHSLNRRAVSVRPTELGDVGCVVVASGGPHKDAILRAVLGQSYIHVLVTDEATGERLVAGSD